MSLDEDFNEDELTGLQVTEPDEEETTKDKNNKDDFEEILEKYVKYKKKIFSINSKNKERLKNLYENLKNEEEKIKKILPKETKKREFNIPKVNDAYLEVFRRKSKAPLTNKYIVKIFNEFLKSGMGIENTKKRKLYIESFMENLEDNRSYKEEVFVSYKLKDKPKKEGKIDYLYGNKID